MSADEVEREFHDQVIDPTAKTFKDLGIEPVDLADHTFHYLVCLLQLNYTRKKNLIVLQQMYRSSSYYDLPPATERERREEKKYVHVLDDQ